MSNAPAQPVAGAPSRSSKAPPRIASKARRALAMLAGCLAVTSAAFALSACRTEQKAVVALPAVGANLAETTVSGISSGAYMAGQFQLAHGDIVIGAGIIAGGPFGCAESLYADLMPGPATALINATKAINGCMLNAMQLWGVPNPPMLARKAAAMAGEGEIAPLASVLQDRVYLFTGRSDRTVMPAIVQAAAEFYRRLGVPEQQIKLVATLDAGHAFVTETEGQACDVTGKPYIVDCDYDQAGDMLGFILGPLQRPAPAVSGALLNFDQRPFTGDLAHHGMADVGAVYVPKACAGPGIDPATRCRVHIAFHGCGQNRELVGDAFIRSTGFGRWADTNRLIVLFPQTTTSPFNPQACWDWWGYTGRDYLTRSAPQTTAVRRMLDRLSSVDRPS